MGVGIYGSLCRSVGTRQQERSSVVFVVVWLVERC
jgi:hypothetical protein